MVEDEDNKEKILTNFLLHERQPDEKVIVFVGRKARANDISSNLCLMGVECASIHGDCKLIINLFNVILLLKGNY